jgi:hypothetical protein
MLAATKPIRVFLEETLVGRSCDEGRSFVHIPVRWREASRQKNNKELTIKPTKKKNEASDQFNADGSHNRLPGVG